MTRSSANHEIDTLPLATEHDRVRERQSVCLSVLVHPLHEMVGARAFLEQIETGQVYTLSRLAPDFVGIDGSLTQPIGDPSVSRQATLLGWHDGLLMTPPPGESRVVVAGQPLIAPKRLDRAALERGVVIELSSRTAVLAHLRKKPLAVPECGLIGSSEALDAVRQQIVRAAPFGVPVLITGETGVGKELVARALHDTGPRSTGPWVAANVAEIKADTAASVLFGHVRGAYTGATQDHDGLFARADGGTLFLDEIGEMAPDVQAMLLRVLETGEVQRLGDRRVRKVNVRVLAATDRDLEARGQLRTPLQYRLAGYHIRVPPLRHRLEDLGALLTHFRDEELARAGRTGPRPWLPARLVTQLAAHKWPGNARELRNLVRTLVIQADGDERLGRGFVLDDWLHESREGVPAAMPAPPVPLQPQISDAVIAAALARNNWNATATARDLGMARSTLYLYFERSASLRKASDVPTDELRSAWQKTGGDVDRMAQLLRVSPRGLRLALRAIGLGAVGDDDDG